MWKRQQPAKQDLHDFCGIHENQENGDAHEAPLFCRFQCVEPRVISIRDLNTSDILSPHIASVSSSAARGLPPASGCNQGFYERTIRDFCLAKFEFDMAGLERGLWCSWKDTME